MWRRTLLFGSMQGWAALGVFVQAAFLAFVAATALAGEIRFVPQLGLTDLAAVELELQATVEIDPQMWLSGVTRRVR